MRTQTDRQTYIKHLAALGSAEVKLPCFAHLIDSPAFAVMTFYLNPPAEYSYLCLLKAATSRFPYISGPRAGVRCVVLRGVALVWGVCPFPIPNLVIVTAKDEKKLLYPSFVIKPPFSLILTSIRRIADLSNVPSCRRGTLLSTNASYVPQRPTSRRLPSKVLGSQPRVFL